MQLSVAAAEQKGRNTTVAASRRVLPLVGQLDYGLLTAEQTDGQTDNRLMYDNSCYARGVWIQSDWFMVGSRAGFKDSSFIIYSHFEIGRKF